jgi:exonuclease III
MTRTYSIAFYNLENLFDYENNEHTLDKDYTPEGVFQWDREKYFQKINNLALVISRIGERRSEIPPVFLGVCEIENETCLQDLINSDQLRPFEYQYVFYKSNDLRGIHVAFLFQKKHFELLSSETYEVALDQNSGPDATRDILLVKGKLFGKPLTILLNHWPSRTDGTKKTNAKRLRAAQLTKSIIARIREEDPDSKIIVMGDFNDDPLSDSLREYLSEGFFNPMTQFQKEKKGSVKYKGKWIMFDQILMNEPLMNSNWFRYVAAHIYVAPFMTQKSGRHKGAPKRTYLGKYFQGGFSDHYPVFIYFRTENP